MAFWMVWNTIRYNVLARLKKVRFNKVTILVLEKKSFQSEKIQNDIPMYNVYFVFSDEIL